MSWYDFMNETLTCPKCGWVGLGSDTRTRESFAEGAERECAVCDHYFGFVPYPLLRESLADPRASEEDKMFAEVALRGARILQRGDADSVSPGSTNVIAAAHRFRARK